MGPLPGMDRREWELAGGSGVLDSLRIVQWILEIEMGYGWQEATSSRSRLYINQP